MTETKTTCGVLITDGSRFLVCHPTNSKWWDIPKGQQDPGESYADTAIRELYEETSIVTTEDQLEYIGHFAYRPNKNLALFWLKVDVMPDPTTLRCKSKFEVGTNSFPEMDGFCIADRDECLRLVNPNMNKVISPIICGLTSSETVL